MTDHNESTPPDIAPYARHLFLCKGCVPNKEGASLERKVAQMLERWDEADNPQQIKVSMVSCLDVCAGGQIGVVYPEGVWYHHLDEDVLERVVDEHLKDGHPVEENIFYRLGNSGEAKE